MILVLEGARRDALWGVYDATGQAVAGARIVDRGAAEKLASAIAAAVAVEKIEALVVGVGPGSFTGLRIVLAFAKALAFARNLPIVGIDSLHAMQQEVAAPAVAVLDAYAGQVFARGPNLPSDVYDPALVREHLQHAQAVCDGPVPSLADLSWIDLKSRPLPNGLHALGSERLQRGERDDASTLLPNYARASSPELKMSKRN